MPSNTMETGNRTDRATLKDIKQDAMAVKQDLGTLASDASDAAKGVAEHGVEAARHGAERAMECASDIAERTRSVHSQACDYVRRNPTTSVLIAVGAGAILGRLLAARR
ncbi:MAG: DUF883 family protein [Phycisphaerales bacterium]|nr:DUF883 family protein [Phycisphaerales bacterium]